MPLSPRDAAIRAGEKDTMKPDFYAGATCTFINAGSIILFQESVSLSDGNTDQSDEFPGSYFNIIFFHFDIIRM